MQQDVSGLFLVISSPYLPVIVIQDSSKLAEAKAKLAKEQTRLEIFEVGTGNLALKLDMRMKIKDFAWS